MSCPCCGLEFIMDIPTCPACKKQVERTQARIVLLDRTYHPDCLWNNLRQSPNSRQNPSSNPTSATP